MSEKLLLSQARTCIRAKTLRFRSNRAHFASNRLYRTGLIVCTFVQQSALNQRFGALN